MRERHAGIAVHTAGSDAAETIASIGSSSFRDAYAAHSAPADLESHLHDFFTPVAVRHCIERNESAYLLATVDAQAVGFAKFRAAPCPLPGGATDAMEVQQLYVLTSMQGHGLGRHLLQAVTALARQQRLSGIWLSCWDQADWAMNFYTRVGFGAIGTADFAVGSTIYNDFLLWRPLPPAEQKS